MLRIDDFVKSQLVLTGWRYGEMYGQGGHLTSCIVMSCIANRSRLGWGNWLDILNNIPLHAAEFEKPTGTPQLWEPSFVRCLHEVDGIYDGSLDYAKGGLYWADLRRIETPFFKEKIIGDLKSHPKIVDMNSFVVFR